MVLRSEDNPDVIMNSLAAYFVAEMDECACALRSDGRIRRSHYVVPIVPRRVSVPVPARDPARAGG